MEIQFKKSRGVNTTTKIQTAYGNTYLACEQITRYMTSTNTMLNRQVKSHTHEHTCTPHSHHTHAHHTHVRTPYSTHATSLFLPLSPTHSLTLTELYSHKCINIQTNIMSLYLTPTPVTYLSPTLTFTPTHKVTEGYHCTNHHGG